MDLRKDKHEDFYQKNQQLIKENEELKNKLKMLERKTSELQLSEEKFRKIYHHMEIGVAYVSLDFHIIEANPSYCQMLGYTQEEIIGKHLKDITREEIIRENLEKQEQLSKGEINHYRIEKQFIHKNGQTIYGILDANMVQGGDGKPAFCIGSVLDITKTKIAQEELVESENKFKTLVEQDADALLLNDLDGNILEVNQASVIQYGYTREELLSMQIKDLDPDYDNREDNGRFFRGMNFNKPRRFEARQKRKNGEFFEAEVTLTKIRIKKQIYIMGLSRDISLEKKAQRNLLESERKYRELIETTSEGFWQIDNKYQTVDVNLSLCKMLGYSREEFLGKSPLDFFEGENKEILKEQMLRIPETDHRNYELSTKTKDGKYITLLSNATTLKNEKGKTIGAFSLLKDITERKENENKLLELTKRFDLAADSAGIGVWNLDIQKNHLTWDERMFDLYGADPVSFVPEYEGWKSFVHPDDIEKADSEVQKTIQTREKFDTEFRIIVSDNKVKFIKASALIIDDQKGKALKMIGINYDITEYKNAIKEAKLREIHLRSIIENPSDYIIYRTRYNRISRKIEVIKVSPSFTKILGLEKGAELVFENWFINIHPDDIPLLMEANIAGMKPPFKFNMVVRYQHPKEGLKWFKIKSTGIPYEDDPMVIEYANGIILDISDLKNAENHLKTALEKAKEADRLKTAFLANMSHEIRTPMNGILGFTELLKNAKYDRENQVKYIDIIQRNGDRLINTINDIIDISRIESGQVKISPSMVDILQQMDELEQFFKPQAEEKGLELIFEKTIQCEDKKLKTDGDKLYAIYTNLIKNAIKFTSKGQIRVGCAKKDQHLEFFVKDTGMGIPKEKQKYIFQRFVQADTEYSRPYEGSGLGLSITKAYVEMLGGEIWFESEPEKGSNFFFSLPNTGLEKKDKSANHETLQESNEGFLIKGIKNTEVLIVEDDETSMLYLKNILSEHCKKLWFAYNGKEALETIRNNPYIDLILMDLKLPIMDGLTATREIRTFNESIYIIAQTAYAMSGDSKKAFQAGCNDYITKPIQIEELYAKLKLNRKP